MLFEYPHCSEAKTHPGNKALMRLYSDLSRQNKPGRGGVLSMTVYYTFLHEDISIPEDLPFCNEVICSYETE